MLQKDHGFQLLLRYTLLIFRQRGIKKARVFFLRSLLHYQLAIKWFRLIDVFHQQFEVELELSKFLNLPTHSYVSNGLRIKARNELLRYHYRRMIQSFGVKVMQDFLLHKPVIFSSLIAKDGQQYHFAMTILCNNIREGGLSICLMDDEKNILSSLTFNFGKNQQKKFLIIGGVQGSTIGKAAIVAATRNLAGLRPKQTLLHCCYSLSAFFKIDYVVGVSDKNHVLSSSVSASYDDFWQEFGGIKMKNADYLLPALLPKRTLQDVPQKKRKDWLLRQEYLSQLNLDIHKFCGANLTK